MINARKLLGKEEVCDLNSLMGIILSDEKNKNLGSLTEKRAIDALPVGGRYRMIDFVLSNMVNSDIDQVGIATQYNYRSLMDHVGSGKAWDLNRKNRGLFILPPFMATSSASQGEGDIGVLHSISNFIRKSDYEYVLLTSGALMYNTTFNDMLDFHIKSEADVSLMYNVEENESSAFYAKHTTIKKNGDGKVTDILKNHTNPESNNVSLDTYIVKRSLLLNIIETAAARGANDFVYDVLLKRINELKIFAYEFKGYVGRVDTIESYYNTNMHLLNTEIRKEMFLSKNKIYTKVKDQVPTHYGEGAHVSECLIADGCKIEGMLENCIVFRGVQIEKGAVVKNSIIMQNSIIQSNCYIENAVLDKEVIIKDGKTLSGQPNYPFVISKGQII